MKSIESVKDYLKSKVDLKFRSPLDSVVKLSGGFTNHVYRLNFEDNSSYILKYYGNLQSLDPATNVNQNRYFVEKECLKLLGNHKLLEETRIRIPELFYADDLNFVLVMQDAGKTTKTLLEVFNSKFQTNNLNDLLDLFSSEIFNFSNFLSSKCGITPLTHKKVFESSWNLIRGYFLPMFSREAQRFNLENELSTHLQNANPIFHVPDGNEGVFTFGDLWPNSILVDVEKNLFWIIDWEAARFETRIHRDLEQFMANLWLMKQNHDMFNVNALEILIKKLQKEYFGNEDIDYRLVASGDDLGKSNFVLWVLSLVQFPNWGLEDVNSEGKDLIKKAIEEIKSLSENKL